MSAFVACQTGDGEIDDTPIGGEPTVIEQVTAEIETSTRVSALIGSDEEFSAFWGTKDKIAITDLTKSSEFTIKRGAGSVNGTFAGSFAPSAETLYAVYPSSAVSLSSGKVVAKIPAEQNYSSARGTDVKDKVVLVGSANGSTDFILSPAAAVVLFDITLPAEREIWSVTVESEKVGIAGKGSIELGSGVIRDLDTKTLCLTIRHVLRVRTQPVGHLLRL